MVVVASEVELQAVVVYEKKDDESRDSRNSRVSANGEDHYGGIEYANRE